MRPRRRAVRVAALVAALLLSAGTAAAEEEFHLFPPPPSRDAAPAFSLDPSPEIEPPPPETDAPPERRCVLIQCETLPIAPSPSLFHTGTSLWTAAGLLVGIVDGIQGPIDYGIHPFSFTDEGYFRYWTYGGGSDKVSHGVVSANAAGLLYDAYRLNGLSEDQSFGLALATSVLSGVFVEIGDGLTPYGFSAQDLTADTLGSLAGTLVKRAHLDDAIGFQFGKVPTTIPPAVLGGRPLFGIDYSQEIYTVDAHLAGVFHHVDPDAKPGVARFFQFSVVFFTKGFGYEPPLPLRYQSVGMEVGLDFPNILRAVGVSNATWWGDTLLRVLEFFRIPYTQVGTYYNFKNKKWYGPGAPYQYY